MIEVQAEVPVELLDLLEEHFCEEVRSPWCIVRITPTSPALLSGYFEDQTSGLEAWDDLRLSFPAIAARPEVTPVADADWKLAYRSHLTYWNSGPLHWVPVWERETTGIPSGDTAIYLDSGMAFGTGSHQTTRLCALAILQWLHDHPEANLQHQTLIDVGCGSGILALSARGLGFGQVFGFDRDPESVRISLENARENNLLTGVEFAQGGIEDWLPERKAIVVVANIQADVLRLYAEDLLAAVLPGGTLILSGILSSENGKVVQAFQTAAGARLHQPAESAFDGDWSSVVLKNLG
ncbi:MAG: 50S ribosomal protein L11 methyltransferase [Puniceicoccaceae bacterium]